jgi:LacI family transcriptional regulator, galactose operon repressor
MVQKPTIKDIARKAKVSSTAVSVALNNRAGVSERTRRRIFKIAEKLQYRPNWVAKSLISQHTRTIGLIIPSITDPFYPEIERGVEKIADECSYAVIASNTYGSLDAERRAIDILRSRGVDGIILTTVEIDDPHIRPLVEDEFPFVLISRYSMDPELTNKMNYVVADNYSGGYQAIEHLYRLGHDRIAIIEGPRKTSTAIQKTQGVLKAMKDFGMKPDPGLMVECGYVRIKAYEATKRLLSGKSNRPSAFFCQDDNMALGAREAILSTGLRIPEDVALVGNDDIDTASLSGIDLTTVRQDQYEMGSLGARILLDRIERTTPARVNKVVLEAKLVKRKSCGYHLKGYVR